MGRLFEEHIKRKINSLNGAWKMRADVKNCGKEEKWYLGITDGETVIVPSVWNMNKNMLTYEGAVWYEKSFYSDGGNLRLCFGAVMTEAEVWFDGEYLGSHYGGFSQFDFILPQVKPGYHRLTVRADNRFDAHSIPQPRVDWYYYGGIIRSVTVEKLEGITILSNRLEYTLSSDFRSADCNFVLELYNSEQRKERTKLVVKIGDRTVFSDDIELNAGEKTNFQIPEFKINDVVLWDIDSPNLYQVSISTDTDDLYDRVGFRQISVENEKILLNGREVEIRGVNRHEEHPEFGFAFPPSLMKRDIDLAVQMGCNAIRGSHYPNAQEFVDYLDEYGILFWSEIPIWGGGFSEEILADSVIVERGLNMHREMVKQYYNHPSVIMWGMHNEILSQTQNAYKMTEMYYDYLKKNGGNRLVVFASNKNTADICYEFTDVICLNEYFGWYYGDVNSWEEFIDRFVEFKNNKGFEKKPIIFSEFGAAAVYGTHDDENIMWSEEYQAKLIGACLNAFHKHPSVAGGFIWQMCDMRTCVEAGLNRARGFNNKGILNEYRKPKLAYCEAKRLYNKFAENEKTNRSEKNEF